jgi:hypothetical protein
MQATSQVDRWITTTSLTASNCSPGNVTCQDCLSDVFSPSDIVCYTGMATLGYCHTYLPRKRDDVILLTDFHVDSTQDQGSMAISFDGNKKVAE